MHILLLSGEARHVRRNAKMMKKSLVKLLPAASALALVVGCAAERDVAYEVEGMQALEPGDPAFQGTPGYDATPANLDLSGAELRGRLGEVGVDDPAWVDGYADGQYASVYSNVDEARNGAVMTIFDIEGGLFHADLAPGTEATFEPQDIYDAPENAAFVTVVGCSGPTAGACEFDQTAESVSVRVGEGDDGARVFNYTARFDDGYGDASVVTGAFTAAP
jgi:hypothetical protein